MQEFMRKKNQHASIINEMDISIDVIGLDSSEELDPVLDLMRVDFDHATSLSDDIDCDILGLCLY